MARGGGPGRPLRWWQLRQKVENPTRSRAAPGVQAPPYRALKGGSRGSIPERRLVVVVDAAVGGPIGPVPTLRLAVSRRFLKLLLGDIHPVAVETRVVFERRPGQREVVLAHPQKAAERRDRVSDLAADLVEHDALDLADPFLVRAVNRGSFHLVATDKSGGFAIACCRIAHCHDVDPLLFPLMKNAAPERLVLVSR